MSESERIDASNHAAADYEAGTGKTILLTGADGFTGIHLTAAAQARGYEVSALDADLTDPKAVAAEVTGVNFDYVIHLAAISAVTHADETALYQVNLFGTLNLLSALSAGNAKPVKVLVASSANIYGNALTSPIDESATPAPINHYAMSKLAMEYMAGKYQELLPLVMVRPFNYTGVGHDERFLIPKLIRHFRERRDTVELGNIDVEREFNDVRSVCRIYLDLLSNGVAGQTYNICTGKAHSLVEVVGTLSRLCGHQLEVKVNPDFVRENEVQRLCGDPQKLQACLGKLEHPSLTETLQWMLDAAPD